MNESDAKDRAGELHALILAGGSGTRLWPWSRHARPKQLLPLVGSTSMLQRTVQRLDGIVPPQRVWILTNAEYVDAVREQLPDVPDGQIIGEPTALGNAAAVGLGAAMLKARAPDATMAVLTADHVIQPVDQFQRALRTAAAAARQGHLVTFGIRPTEPATGFGYIELGDPIPLDSSDDRAPSDSGRLSDDPRAVHRVERFVEKPDRERAEEYVARGTFVWNSGMFVWTVQSIWDAYRSHLPGTYECLERLADLERSDHLAAGLSDVWATIPDRTTVDYGIMEPSTNVACVPVAFEWHDIGSWAAMAEIRAPEADRAGNIIVRPPGGGRAVSHDTEDTLVFTGGGRLVATVGLRGMIVVDTGDAVLVMPRDRAEDVKRVVAALEEDDDPAR